MIDERNTHIAEEDNGRTLEQIISDAEERRFAKLPAEPMTPERLHAMAAARRSAAHRRRRRVLGGIAAVVALVLIGTLIAVSSLSVDVGADKNRKEEIRTEDGVIIEDGGYGASDNMEGTWSTDNWDDVAATKTLYPQLRIPEYIPEGYAFQKLTIEQMEIGDITGRYSYLGTDGEELEIDVYIQKNGETSIDTNKVAKIVECSKGLIYIYEEDNKIATIQVDDGISILVWSILSDEELKKVIENISG